MSDKSAAAGAPPETPKEFQPIEDPTEAEHLLKESAKSIASAMVWTRDQKHVVKSNVSRYEPAQKTIVVRPPKGFEPRAFHQALSDCQSNDCYFSVSLEWANIFFKSTFTGFDAEGLLFRVPDRIFKVQRRKDLRFRIPEGQTHKVQFLDPAGTGASLTKKLYDVSASGFAFLVPSEEEPSFAAGTPLKNITFEVGGRVMTVEGQVRHCKAVTVLGKPVAKVGVIFTAIRPGDAQKIASFVFEESRKYFLRFV